MSGWLLLFVALAAANCVAGVIYGVLAFIDVTDNVVRGEALFRIGLSLDGGFCVRALTERRRDAPAHTRRWLGLLCLSTLAIVAVNLMVGLPTEGLGRPILPSLLWLVYFAKSRRVAVVYR